MMFALNDSIKSQPLNYNVYHVHMIEASVRFGLTILSLTIFVTTMLSLHIKTLDFLK